MALFNLQNPSQAMRDMYYLRQLAQARSDRMSTIQHSLNRLRMLAEAIHKQKTAINRTQEEYAAQNKKLTQAKLQHKTILDQVSHKIQQQHNQISLMMQDEKRIIRLLSKLNEALKQEKIMRSFTIASFQYPSTKIQTLYPLKASSTFRFEDS